MIGNAEDYEGFEEYKGETDLAAAAGEVESAEDLFPSANGKSAASKSSKLRYYEQDSNVVQNKKKNFFINQSKKQGNLAFLNRDRNQDVIVQDFVDSKHLILSHTYTDQ